MTNITFSEGTEEDTKQRLIKVMGKAKKWRPGIHNNKVVRSYFTLPITITVNKN